MWKTKLIISLFSMLLIFAIVATFLILYLRQRSFNLQRDSVENQGKIIFNTSSDELPQAVQDNITRERYSQDILVRGLIVSSLSSSNHLEVLRENIDNQGRKQQEIVVLDLSNINKVLCWPHFFSSATGEQIDISQAYMPINKTSILFMRGETTRQTTLLKTESIRNKYLFALLDSVSSPDMVVKQVAILDCPN
jgi:hypothetical protein